MASILPAGLQVLAPFMPYLKPIYLDSVSTFCSVDPPGNPSLVGLTIGAVLAGGEVGAGLVAADALTQLLLNYLWYQTCECSAMATPAPPAAPTLPTIPVLNPPAVVAPPTTQGCALIQSPQLAPGAAGTWRSLLGTVDASGTPLTFDLVPAGATSVVLTAQRISSGASHVASNLQFLTYNNTPTLQQFWVPTWAANVFTTQTHTITLTSADVKFVADTNTLNAGPDNTDLHQITAQFYCGTTPGQPVAPCCPPDPTLVGMITQILNAVNLVQRQSAPFGYVYGTNHTGLTGNGSISVADLIGVSVDLTTIPSSYGLEDGSPVEYFDLGFVTLGTTDGFTSSRRLDHDGTLLLPPSAGVFTTIGYTLRPGVVASIRELVREP